MAFSINTNVASLQAQNYLRANSAFQGKTINEVTSGLRIVQSGDDAAGLAIANGYRSDRAVLTQGVQNASDGMSQLQIMDGGMSNISMLLDRARTLATQSATGTFTGDRGVLNSEFQSVLGEIDRQAQAIGLNTGGTFAKNLAVFIGGGKTSGSVSAISDGSVSVNLSQSTVDSSSLGLKGVQAIGTKGSDIGAGSGLTSVTSILANAGNVASAAPNTTTFYLKGPGFDSQGVAISVNTKNIGGTSDLVAAINTAITSAANGGTQAGTALKNANVTASVNTDSAGAQQLTFNSSVAAFQVVAGDQTANALMGNFQALNSVAKGTDTSSTVNTTAAAAHTISFQFDGSSSTTVTVSSGNSTLPTGTGTTKAQIASALNGNATFHASATASLNGNQLVITSNNATAASAVKAIDGGAGSLSRALGLTSSADTSFAASSASTGASLGTSVMGSAVTGAGSKLFTASTAGNLTVRFSGAGLTSPVDITVAAAVGESLTSAVSDLNTQVSSNSALKAAGITLDPTSNSLDGNHQLVFRSTGGQGLNVAVTGDTTNQLGFGSFQAGNTTSGNNGAFDYTTLTGTSYAAGTSGVQGLTAGTGTLQFSINGQSSSANAINVNLATLATATAATVTGTQTIASPVTISAAGAVAASSEISTISPASLTFGAAAEFAMLQLGGGTAGINFTSTAAGALGNATQVAIVQGAGALSSAYAGGTLTITMATGGNTATAINTYLGAAGAASMTSAGLTSALVSTGAGNAAVTAATSLSGGGDAGMTFTSKASGTAGNSSSVSFVNSGNNSTLSVLSSANGNIVVNLGTDQYGNVNSNASAVKTALDGSGAAAFVTTTLTGDGNGAVASHTANLAGGNTDGLTFTSVTPGAGANGNTITFQSAANSALGIVSTTNGNIIVNLAATAGNVVTSTSTQVAALLNGDVNASALVTTGLVGTGSSLATAQVVTLANGAASGANTNNELNLMVGGNAYNVKLGSGANISLNSIAQQINTVISSDGTATVKNNQLVLTSTLKGAGAALTVEAGSANNLLGLTPASTTYGTSATGSDIASYLNQQFAANNNLQAAGLQANFTGSNLTIASNNGTNFRINEIATTAASASTVGTASFTTENTSSVVQGGSGAAFNVTTAQALKFTVNGSAQTVNFGIKNYTKQEVLDAINSQATGVTASLDSGTGKIQLVSNATGASANTIVVDTNANSTANTVLEFSAGATATGVASTNTADITGANDTLNLKIDGTQLTAITLTHGTALLTTARTMANVASDLTLAFTAQSIGATATVVDGQLQIASTSSGPNSSVQIQAGNANATLGLSTGVTSAANTNLGFGVGGATFTGNASSGPASSTPAVDSGGASQTSDIAFSPLLYGTDAQTISVAANNASGAQQSTSIVLQNNGANRSGRSIDEAVNAINTQLQQSNNSTLQKIVAVKDDVASTTGGPSTEQIKFMSTLGGFQVSVGSNGNVTGLGSTAQGSETVPAAQQGTTLSSALTNGGSSADISNQSAAEAAVTALSSAVSTLGSAQAVVGRGENTFNYATNLAQSQLTNLSSAESGIRDADLAAQAANLTKAQILMQAGVAALAQANSAPQQILTLLRG